MEHGLKYQNILNSVLKKSDSPNSDSKKKKVEFCLEVSESPSPVTFGVYEEESTYYQEPVGVTEVCCASLLESTEETLIVESCESCDQEECMDEEEVVEDEDEGEERNWLYSCRRCRAVLFSSAQTVPHPTEAGDVCDCFLFVPYFRTSHYLRCGGTVASERTSGQCEEDLVRIAVSTPRDGASDSSAPVLCRGCDSRFGQYCEHHTRCSCGTMVKGPVVRVGAAKVDRSRADNAELSPRELAHRAAAEIAALRLDEERRELEAAERGAATRKAKKKPARQKREGEGNFSMFRNKTFKGKGAGAQLPAPEPSAPTSEKRLKKRGGRGRKGSLGASGDEEDL
jgi:hypothetical protein